MPNKMPYVRLGKAGVKVSRLCLGMMTYGSRQWRPWVLEEREMIPLCLAEGVGCIPWSPLARGFLASNRHREGGGQTARAQSDDFAEKLYYRPSDFAVAEKNIAIARKLAVKPMQTALAWILSNPAVTSPIIGASKLEHLDDALQSLDIALSQEDKAALEEPYEPHPVLGFS